MAGPTFQVRRGHAIDTPTADCRRSGEPMVSDHAGWLPLQAAVAVSAPPEDSAIGQSGTIPRQPAFRAFFGMNSSVSVPS
jgi:hypothetical protein